MSNPKEDLVTLNKSYKMILSA